eukprot:gene9850-6171_t
MGAALAAIDRRVAAPDDDEGSNARKKERGPQPLSPSAAEGGSGVAAFRARRRDGNHGAHLTDEHPVLHEVDGGIDGGTDEGPQPDASPHSVYGDAGSPTGSGLRDRITAGLGEIGGEY